MRFLSLLHQMFCLHRMKLQIKLAADRIWLLLHNTNSLVHFSPGLLIMFYFIELNIAITIYCWRYKYYVSFYYYMYIVLYCILLSVYCKEEENRSSPLSPKESVDNSKYSFQLWLVIVTMYFIYKFDLKICN